MNPKISVIIPAYNAEKYLEKCLDSIFNQTFKDFEVILVNDGSTDNTRRIAERYAAEHTNMILLNQENGGISTARNKGLEQCQGEYITFSDSDDYADSDWLEHFVNATTSNGNCDFVIEGLIVDYNGKKNRVDFCEEKYENEKIIDAYLMLKNRNIEGFLFNKLYKKSVIEENHIRFEYTLKEDLLFNLKYLYHTSSMVTIPSACYHYVQHGSQSLIHRRYPADYMKGLITSLYHAAVCLSEKYSTKNFRKKVIEEYMISYSVLLFSMYNKKNGVRNKAERMEYIKEYQQIRKKNKDIKICTGSKTKRLFAKFMMLPPNITDAIIKMIILIKIHTS